MRKKSLIFFLILILSFNFPILAQSVDSTNYTLVGPTIDGGSGITNSSNYSNLNGTTPVDEYSTDSTNYNLTGGNGSSVQAKVATVSCFETSTNSGSTSCTGVPGSNGMQGVCGSPGCYDRAKVEINTQNNPDDTRYAMQISTDSTFATNIFYVSGTTHVIKSTLTISDFLFKCDWEGTILAGYCASANTTWQKYNVLGLTPGTQYYLRIAALHGSSTTGSFTQAKWSQSATATTQNTTISFDIDVGSNSSATSNPPYIVKVENIIPENTYTSNGATTYFILRTSTNALNGEEVYIKSQNGALTDSVSGNTLSTFSGDLDSTSNGFGIRNDSTTNSQVNSGFLGNINISSSPIDFTDTGATNKVGGPTTTYNKILDSQSLPLTSGVAAFKTKVRADFSKAAGHYTENLVFTPVGIF